ncbi:VWA domain-containing protein [Candidatus Saccharibacteria bacterium]|jgi:hypothetical protein|nr:VWA domain-containing protein [Candidatus Saccharibacteria bacterium]
MKELPPTQDNNVIHFCFSNQNQEVIEPDSSQAGGDIISLRDELVGDTANKRRVLVEIFIYDNLSRLDDLPDRVRDYVMGQIYIYEQGKSGEDVVVLEEVLQDVEDMVASNDTSRLFQDTLKTDGSSSSAELGYVDGADNLDNGSGLRLIDGGQSNNSHE